MIKMEISKALIGRCSILDSNSKDVNVNFTDFVRGIIIFDRYILKSIRLKEILHLLRVFGYYGLIDLLQSGAVKIHCDAITIGQTGQTNLKSRIKKGILPICSYAFSLVSRDNWQTYIERCLRENCQADSLTLTKRNKLNDTILSATINYPEYFGKITLSQLNSDISNNVPIIKNMITRTIGEKVNASIDHNSYNTKFYQLTETDFKLESNIGDTFNIDPVSVHKLVEKALLAVGGLNQRIEEMQSFSAISGFTQEEYPIFGDKLNFLITSLLPKNQERRLQRVLNIAGISEIDKVDKHTKLDANKIIEIRDSIECREFRSWLSSIDISTDDEIRNKVKGFNSKFSTLIHTKPGKDIRFLTTTGLGFIPVVGNILGPVLSSIDHFLIDRVIPFSGPAIFINKMYPSIFIKEES